MEPTPTRRRVLVVDDDAATLDAVRETLEESGWEVACAENGRRAIEWLGQTPPPSVILMDLMMPIMNGWQLRSWLRESSTLSGVPVVVQTAAGDAAVASLPSLEPATLLEKPFRRERLLETLERACEKGSGA